MSRTPNGNLAGRAARADDLAIPFEPTDTMRWNSKHLAELHQWLGHDKFHDFYSTRCLLDSEELKFEILAEYAEAWKALEIVVAYCPPDLPNDPLDVEGWPWTLGEEHDEVMNRYPESGF